MEYIPATDLDKEYFATLSELVYRDLVEKQLGIWDAEKENSKFEEKWKEQEFRKIKVKGEIVGGFWIQELNTHFQLREIQIHPNFQNMGIGTEVLNNLIAKAQNKGKELRLRVLLSNPAINLYKRLGFKVAGQTSTQLQMFYGL